MSGSLDDLDQVKTDSPVISDYANVSFTAGPINGTPLPSLTFTSLEFTDSSTAKAGWERILAASRACTRFHDSYGTETVSTQPVPGLLSLSEAGHATSYSQRYSDSSEPFINSVGVQLTGRYLLFVEGAASTLVKADNLALRGWRWFAAHLPTPHGP